jgi:hypothetical protein
MKSCRACSIVIASAFLGLDFARGFLLKELIRSFTSAGGAPVFDRITSVLPTNRPMTADFGVVSAIAIFR